MKKKAIILDLDNTIFPVPSIGHKLFAPLFELIEQEGSHKDELEKIKDEVMRRPFQQVAKEHHFNEELIRKCVAVLKELVYNDNIEPFEDYAIVKRWPVDKFLVTTGFVKMQQSKVDRLGLAADFKEIHIVDPATTNKTKKDVFADIIQRHGYSKEEVLVAGDDPNSEIKAAHELGIDAVLYDKFKRYPDTTLTTISNYEQLGKYVSIT